MKQALKELIEEFQTFEVHSRDEMLLLDRVITATEEFQKHPALEMHRCSRCLRPTPKFELKSVLIDRFDWTKVCGDCVTKHDCLC